ncbi:armadillo-type protein [Aspergillus spinulosporus]
MLIGQMESTRQKAFRKLREPCVELSSVGLKFRGHQASPGDVLQALRSVYYVLDELAGEHVLDEKLAEYAFFPLAHIFNESKRSTVNVLELAVNCLRLLVAEGWKARLSPQMGKQLIILLTLIVGGAPDSEKKDRVVQTSSVELEIAGFNCLFAIFDVLSGPTAEQTIYHEIGTATVVDQTVYLLLEAIIGDRSDELCISAAKALEALYRRVSNRVVLASIMPRTVSALTKVLKPTTQTRRSYRLLVICLRVLSGILKAVLNDRANSQLPQKSAQPQGADETLVLDESWLKATTTQIKLALSQVIQLRRHDREEVQVELLNLCIMIIEDCLTTLQESIPMLVETVVVLSKLDEQQTPNNAYSSLKYLATTHPTVLDSLKNSLHTWLTAFPRTMQSNDETAKQWAIKQITTAFQILSELQSESDFLTNDLTAGLCDSVAVIANRATSALQPLNPDLTSNQTLEILGTGKESVTFLPVLLDHKSQQQTLKDLREMISRLNFSNSAKSITRLIINRIYEEQGNSIIAPLWLATTFLKDTTQSMSSLDDFITLDDIEPSRPFSTRASMIDELYYISLPILNETMGNEENDWRVSALALEAVALQAQELQEAFRTELMDALYPVLERLASNNQALQRHAMTCLNVLTQACGYADTSTMIVENVDYLVNSVAIKLNTFDVSPYPPQVLLMMVKLCGARLVPYLDDLIDSIFGILDLYHGYPKLVELMFQALSAIVEESTKAPSILAIENGTGNAPDHLKRKYQELSISTLAEDFARRKAKQIEDAESAEDDGLLKHPTRPWTEEREDKAPKDILDSDSLSDILGRDETEPLPPPREPENAEKPPSKTHSLLLHIVKSLPLHLSSPSPYLRRSLLSILIDILPVLAADENSFLPLINDLWPAVISKISFPSSIDNTSSPSSTAILNIGNDIPNASTGARNNQRDRQKQAGFSDEFDFKEETFVATTACKAVETMFKSAGDFMASRVEAAFPRWERMYNRAWEKVCQDTDRIIERQQKQYLLEDPNVDESSTALSTQAQTRFIQSLSLTRAGSSSGSRAFTPHHILWRALISLFLTMLSHVRLPLAVGDRICLILGEWIARYAGPGYYSSRVAFLSKNNDKYPAGVETEIDSIESAIQAMETWNSDLTWFIFQQQDVKFCYSMRLKNGARVDEQSKQNNESGSVLLSSVAFNGGRLRFAEMSF